MKISLTLLFIKSLLFTKPTILLNLIKVIINKSINFLFNDTVIYQHLVKIVQSMNCIILFNITNN